MASSERVKIPKGWKLTRASMATCKDGGSERKVRLYFKDSKKGTTRDIETPFSSARKRKVGQEDDDINKYREFILLCYNKGWGFEWPMSAPTVKLCNEHFPALRDAESGKKFPRGHYTKASMRKFLLRLKDKHPDLRYSVTPSTWKDACARVELPTKYSLDDFHWNMENLVRGDIDRIRSYS